MKTDGSGLSELAAIPLNDRDGPLYRQVYRGLRQAILEGRLAAHSKLPASRSLAKHLGVGRNTVTIAYDQLAAEGYIAARTGAGSFVAETLPDPVPGEKGTERKASTSRPALKLSERGKALLRLGGARRQAPVARPFAAGQPDPDAFPFPVWSRLLARVWRRPAAELIHNDDPMGYAPLRHAIAAFLRASRALDCDAGQVMVVSGAQQALDLICRVVLDPGDRVWVEDPGFPGVDGALGAVGGEIVPVSIDGSGLDVAYGNRRAPDARAVLCTPSRNYPLGTTMSLQRRLELLRWAEDNDAWIVEDDYDSEFRYDGRPLTSLQGLDRAGRVIYVGTFSRILFPAARLGYVVAPPDLMPALVAVRTYMDGHTTLITQAALAAFFDDGHFSSHLRRMRSLYRARRDCLLEALARECPSASVISAAESGTHLVIAPPWAGTDYGQDTGKDHGQDVDMSATLEDAGLTCPPLSRYFRESPGRAGLILGFARFGEDDIRSGIRRLAEKMGAVPKVV